MTWGRVEPGWPPGGSPPPEGECHLWVTRLAEAGTTAASHALQHVVVGHYLATDSRQVTIARTCHHCGSHTHGRPQLVEPGLLDFSVTHSGEWVVMAVVGAGRVGVDLEFCRPLPDADDLAATVLGAAEADEYRSLPAEHRAAWFYRAWVRKEAVVKLTGHGLLLEPAQVDVRGDVAVIRDPVVLPRDPVQLRDLPAPAGHAAALATTLVIRSVRLYQLSGHRLCK